MDGLHRPLSRDLYRKAICYGEPKYRFIPAGMPWIAEVLRQINRPAEKDKDRSPFSKIHSIRRHYRRLFAPRMLTAMPAFAAPRPATERSERTRGAPRQHGTVPMLPQTPRQPRFALMAGGGFLLLGGAVLIAVTQVLDLSPQRPPDTDYLLAALWVAVLASGAALYALLRPFEKRLQGLAESAETMRRLLESHPGSIFSLDLDGRYTNVHKTTALTGYAPDELVGRHYSELLIPEDRERVGEAFAAIARGEPRVLDTTILTKDGDRIPASVTVIPVVARGRVVGVHGIAQDISERNRV